jgi:hypothetical protein
VIEAPYFHHSCIFLSTYLPGLYKKTITKIITVKTTMLAPLDDTDTCLTGIMDASHLA